MSLKLFNIQKGKIDEEKVCAESFMRFLYGTQVGRLTTFAIFKRLFFSRLCGLWADSKRSKKSILKFIADNQIDISEFKNPASQFGTFNDFFTRELADDKRPLAENGNANAVSFPSDGRHLLIENITQNDTFYAKGIKFNLAKFLGDEKLALRFENGSMLISRLAPVDYHRFHYPISGEIIARKSIDGKLFSVSPIALSERLSVFWENKRIVNLIESRQFGVCAFVEIGATNVGCIENFGKLGDVVERGEQAGMFRFGGSCVATIFPKENKIEWNSALREYSPQSIECYARVNELAGIKES